MTSSFTTIRYSVEASVATVMLDRPAKLNAFTATMQRELCAAFDLSDADDDVRAVIVTGAGRAFCAGADLSDGAKTFAYPPEPGLQVPRDLAGLVALRVFRSLKPVISACNGAAVGVGVTMQLAMDIRLASTAARFGFVFPRIGIVPEGASTWFLPRLVGMATALEWCCTGRIFTAQEARERGLVRSLHEPDELLDAARALAHEIADNTAPVSVATTRQMLWRMAGVDHPMKAHEVESQALYSRGKSSDAGEGVSAFLEKRAARYRDRVSADMPDFLDWRSEPQFLREDSSR